MNTLCTPINRAIKPILLFLTLIYSVDLSSQQSNLTCNTPSPWIPPLFTNLTVSHSSFGLACWEGDVACPGDDVPANVVNASTSDFAFGEITGVGELNLRVTDGTNDYSAGNFAGFRISSGLLDISLLGSITISTYLNNVFVESVSGGNLLIVDVNFGLDEYDIGFVTTASFDAVEITIDNAIGIGDYLVYYAIMEDFCPGPTPDCNELTEIHNPEYPVYIDGEHTGITGVACALCDVINTENVIDDDLSNYAEIIVVAGVLSVGSLAVKDQLSDYPAGTFAGFHIENPSLINANALTGITISTYLDGTLQESETNLGALITVGSGLLVGTGEQYVGFVTTEPFDEVKISLSNVATFDIGTTRVYGAVLENFCAAEIECDTTYYLNNPEFPVYIDAFLTGVDGVACVACEVEDEQNVITADTSDYGTITVVANVIGSASIAVADALYTYPEGTFAGFVIEDLGFLLEADLFESLIISTYLDGEFQESRFGGDLIDLAVIILFISADEGRYNVGFETTLPFDEIRITVGSLASVINQVRVYSAFVDTRASEGGTLLCIDGPLAVDDYAATDEETPVVIDVLQNDSDPEGPIGEPQTVEGPIHGSVVLNADSTYTYTPDDNFVGLDTFSYAICNNDATPLCDTALVIITVNPVIDTIEETIPENTSLTICADDITTFNTPANSISICDPPSHGTATVMGECVTYTPDPGFNGNDTMCIVVCHPALPAMCDTTIVIITVTPVDAPPVANNDLVITDQDEPVVIDVLENDSDPDSPLGFPTIVNVPDNGTVVVNPDSTITYTPDENFVGVDTFMYEICDDTEPPLCDSALVIITVIPSTDTITELIFQDSTLEFCVSAWVKFQVPVESVGVCGEPENGIVIVIDTCIQYIPDPGFSGEDTLCVVACSMNDECDTAVVIIIVDLPLPVRWLTFEAERRGTGIELNWKTADERNVDRYEIERSVGTALFNKIGEVDAVIQSQGIQHYVYTDPNPVVGINYYRIKEVDMDGTHGYSPVKSVVYLSGDRQWKIWPNPSDGLMTIELPVLSEQQITVRIMNASAQVVFETMIDGDQQQQSLDLSSLTGGVYTIAIESVSFRVMEKIVLVK